MWPHSTLDLVFGPDLETEILLILSIRPYPKLIENDVLALEISLIAFCQVEKLRRR